jgi:hypothetical protein
MARGVFLLDGQNHFLNIIFKASPVQDYYLGLMTNVVNPDVTDQLGSGITEVTGTDYARILLTRDTDWLVVGPLAESLAKIFTVGAGGWIACNGFFIAETLAGNDAILAQVFNLSMQGDYLEGEEIEVISDIQFIDSTETCRDPALAPVAYFRWKSVTGSTFDTLPIPYEDRGDVYLKDYSTNDPTSWLWEIYNFSTLEWDVLGYTQNITNADLSNPDWLLVDGTDYHYDIRLTATNAMGSDTTYNSLHLNEPAPIASYFNWRDSNYDVHGDYRGAAFHQGYLPSKSYAYAIDLYPVYDMSHGSISNIAWSIYNWDTLSWDVFNVGTHYPIYQDLSNANWNKPVLGNPYQMTIRMYIVFSDLSVETIDQTFDLNGPIGGLCDFQWKESAGSVFQNSQVLSYALASSMDFKSFVMETTPTDWVWEVYNYDTTSWDIFSYIENPVLMDLSNANYIDNPLAPQLTIKLSVTGITPSSSLTATRTIAMIPVPVSEDFDLGYTELI